MSIEELASIMVAGVAFNGALYLLWYAGRKILQQRRQARDQKLWQEAWQPGDHEYCDLTDYEQGWFDYFANRYRGLGEGVTR